jgi:hypothetical protein
MLDPSDSSCQWEVYGCGAKQIGKQIYSPDQVYDGNAGIILNWLFYHDALSRFSARHWRRGTIDLEEFERDDQIIRAVQLSGNTSKVLYVRIVVKRYH